MKFRSLWKIALLALSAIWGCDCQGDLEQLGDGLIDQFGEEGIENCLEGGLGSARFIYADVDGDGFGTNEADERNDMIIQCMESEIPESFVLTTGDCNDQDPTILF